MFFTFWKEHPFDLCMMIVVRETERAFPFPHFATTLCCWQSKCYHFDIWWRSLDMILKEQYSFPLTYRKKVYLDVPGEFCYALIHGLNTFRFGNWFVYEGTETILLYFEGKLHRWSKILYFEVGLSEYKITVIKYLGNRLHVTHLL